MPDRDFNAGGHRGTGRIRIRSGWLGFAVVEELIENIHGEMTWRRIPFPIDIQCSERR